MAGARPYYIAGHWKQSQAKLEVINPCSGSAVGATSYAAEAHVEEAVTAAQRAFEETRRLSSYKRFEILMRIRRGMEERRDEIVRLIVQEAGKPIRSANREFDEALNLDEPSIIAVPVDYGENHRLTEALGELQVAV